MGAIVRGIGVYIPEQVLTNADLEKMVETTDEWIQSRTGIRERRIVPMDSPIKASDMGAAAAKHAMARAGVGPEEIDGIICGAICADKQFPSTACFIQAKIGARNAFAYDVTAACAGFVFAMSIAAPLVESGQCRNVLVIGSELLSRIVDWKDRNTCILFGDGAGAVVLGRGPQGRGVLQSQLKSDGTLGEILYVDPPGVNRGVFMDGKQVFKSAVTVIADIVTSTLAKSGYSIEDLDLLVMHQANMRILTAITERLAFPMEKVVVNVDHFGNTSAASVPLALFEAEQQGRIKPGMLVALAAVGGGMSWGCNLIRW